MSQKVSDAQNMTSEMETLIQSVQDISIQISFVPSLLKVLSDPHNATVYDYVVLREDLSSYVHTNPLIKSIYAYLQLNDTVVTTSEGIYLRSDFFDAEIINSSLEKKNNISWHSLRKIPDYLVNEDYYLNILSFATTIPYTRLTALGTLVINMETNIFYNLLQKSNRYDFSDNFVIDENGIIIIHKDKKIIGRSIDDVYFNEILISNTKKSIIKSRINEKKYYVTYIQSDLNEWTYINLIPTIQAKTKINNELIIAVAVLLVALFVGLILSYYFSIKMHYAWKQLLLKLGNFLQVKALNNYENDEYSVVSSAIDNLLKYNNDINQIIEETKPIIKDRVIIDLLWNNETIKTNKERLDFTKVNFIHHNFFAMVVSIDFLETFESSDQKVNKRIYCQKVIEQTFLSINQSMGVILDDDNLAFVMNTEHDNWNLGLRNSLITKCTFTNGKLHKELNLNLFFSIGPIVSNLEKLHQSFFPAIKQLNFRSLLNRDHIIFTEDQNESFSYPIVVQKQILTGIKKASIQMVETAVDNLFEEYIAKSDYSYKEVQHMIIVLLGAVESSFWSEGIETDITSKNNPYTMVTQSLNPDMLKNQMLNYFVSMMQEQQNDNRYVEETLTYIHENYSVDISTVDIAEHVGLHPTYLGRLFKSNLGRTIIGYLSFFRIEKAKELINENNLSMYEISSRVGFNDVHSFIRYFKKYEGITPGKYRD